MLTESDRLIRVYEIDVERETNINVINQLLIKKSDCETSEGKLISKG